MGWTVIKEDEDGKAEYELSRELRFSDIDILCKGNFRLLKYLDPYGDTTFNQFMLDDLILDLNEFKAKVPKDEKQIDELLWLVNHCKKDGAHTYLKFYGD